MKKIILIPSGDAGGIGPEIALKAVTDKRVYKICRPVLIGSIDVLNYYSGIQKKKYSFSSIENLNQLKHSSGGAAAIPVIDPGPFIKEKINPGRINSIYGRAAMDYIEFAACECIKGHAHAMVTCPISKESIVNTGIKNFQGHTEYLVNRSGCTNYSMTLYFKENSRHSAVSHISTHIPLRSALKMVKTGAIVRTGILLNDFFLDIGVKKPVIAVAGLNPHAGEQGLFGLEEKLEIIPAINELNRKNVRALGPVSPDVVFAGLKAGRYHGVVALYHDQGHIAMKTMLFNFKGKIKTHGVNITLGLPIIRTSVDHGTGFDIA
ncbi:MAG: 4-hydroxythreonine-4-phosphate dehydrogenase PdxA, partial [bacterium]